MVDRLIRVKENVSYTHWVIIVTREPLAANWPYMTGVGNHEGYYNFTSFNARYHMPGDEVRNKVVTSFNLDWIIRLVASKTSGSHSTTLTLTLPLCPPNMTTVLVCVFQVVPSFYLR